MRISGLKLHSIAIADPPLRSSYGLHAPWALRTIVELETDDGIRGISETYGGEAPRAALEALRPSVLGMDPFRLAGLFEDLNRESSDTQQADVPGGRSQTWLVPGENPLDQVNRSFAAIEIACLDIIGKATGQPVCDVIGGRVRDEVSFSAYLFYKHAGGGGDGGYPDEYGEVLSPEALVRECRQMVHQYGFREIKLKGGVLDPDVEIASIRTLRDEFGPAMPLRIDPNCAWSVDTSVHVGEALAEELSGAGYLEDPCPGLEGMAEVQERLIERGIQTSFGSNVAVTSFPDVPRASQLDAVQIVLSDPHYWGGLRQVQYLSHLCSVLGMGLSMHSNSHLGVSLMAMTHVAAASPNLSFACDTHYPWQTERDEVVAGGRIPIREWLRAHSGSSRAWVSNLITISWREGANVTQPSRSASATMKPKCANTWTRTGSEFFRAGSHILAAVSQREFAARLRGVFGFPVTPFKNDLSLDLAALERNVDEMAEWPFCAMVAAGGTGELYSLTPGEAELVVRTAVSAVNGRMPVVAGTGFNAALGTEIAQRAERAGADAILILPPYYIASPESGLFAYYEAIASATSLPVMIYSRDWAVFTPEMVARLSDAATITGRRGKTVRATSGDCSAS